VIGRRIAKYYMHVIDDNEGVQLFFGSIVGYEKKKEKWIVHYSDDKKEVALLPKGTSSAFGCGSFRLLKNNTFLTESNK
jgi:hypothetical protein